MNGNAAAMKRSARSRTHTGGRVTRTKPIERNNQFEGIYHNARFMHAAASMVGCNVHVQTVEGSVYEGIFRTFSPQFECVVELAHKVDKTLQKINHISAPSKDSIVGKLIFGSSDFVMLTMTNADLDYATKDRFATDNAISKFNGQAGERDLEPWDETSADGIEMPSLEIDNANGWDVNDMFRTNEQQYGVQSTYDSALSGYTMQLEKKNTDEYKKQEAKALKIASEIEGSASYRARIALENTDEDEKISSVVRPSENSNCVGKYVPPAKRKIQQGGGKLTRSSISPQSSYTSSGSKSLQGVPHNGPPPPLHGMQSNSSGVVASSHLVSRYSHSPQHHSISSSSSANTSPLSPANKPLLNQAPLIQSPDNEAKINGDKLEKEDRKHSVLVVDAKMKGDEPRDGDSKLCGDGPPQTSALMQQLPISTANHIPSKFSRKIVNPKVALEEVAADLKKFKSNFKLSDDKKDDSNKHVEQTENKDKIDCDLDKMSNTLKKSTLNPNAKEFVFNPNAKSFTPRSPSTPQTPTPPRPHTPGAGVMCAPPPSLPVVQPHIYTSMPTQYMMSAPISAVSLSAASPMSQAAAVAAMQQQQQQQQQQGPRFRKSTPTSVQHRPDYTPSMHVAAATGQPILASAAMATPPSFIQYTPQGIVQAPGAPQHGMPYTQMYSVVAPRIMTPQGMTMVSTSHLVTHPDQQHVPSQIFVSPHHGVHQALPPGPTPPHQATTPIPSMTPGGQHPNAGSQQGPMGGQGQVTGMHPTPSPVHGNTPNTQNPQQNSAPPLPYQATHGPLGQSNVQQGPHNTPNSPQSIHPGATPSSMAQANHHFHPGASIVAHSGGGQGHPHPSQANYPGGPQPSVVLIHQQGPGTPTPMSAHPQGVPTHTLQGHALHGHAGAAQVAHLVPHTSMAMPIIPATSSGAIPTQHQIYIQHPSAHTHGPTQTVQTYPHAQ